MDTTETSTITFEQFAQLDLRVARILEAFPVEGAKKLYRLRVEVGGEERTLMAGIAQHYKLEELPGKRIVIVANLQPRVIRGVESRGMLLAAFSEDDSVVSLLTPDREVPTGSKVS